MPIRSTDPTGHIKLFAANSIPLGYLSCNGSVLATSTYPSLFAVISNNFNVGGEGAGNFRLPDFRGKSRIGRGQDTLHGLTLRATGQYFGSETVALTQAQLAIHSHSGTTATSSDTHVHTGTANTASLSHHHNYFLNSAGSGNNGGHAGEYTGYATTTSTGNNISLLHNHPVSFNSTVNTHQHSFTSDGGYSTTSVALTGTASGHNTMMPSLVLTMCIKY